MKDQDLAIWLALSFTPKLGSRTISHLLATQTPTQLQSLTPKQWLALGLKSEQLVYLTTEAAKQAEQCLQWRDGAKNRYIVTPHCALYPRLLKEISVPPPVLFIEGLWEVLHDPAVAIVGSRDATIDGRQIARQFAGELAQSGLVVLSGLALGIDGYAHDGALQAQGQTVAVLGSGLTHIYPKQHQALAQRILTQGALVSEFAPFVPLKRIIFHGVTGSSVGYRWGWWWLKQRRRVDLSSPRVMRQSRGVRFLLFLVRFTMLLARAVIS